MGSANSSSAPGGRGELCGGDGLSTRGGGEPETPWLPHLLADWHQGRTHDGKAGMELCLPMFRQYV